MSTTPYLLPGALLLCLALVLTGCSAPGIGHYRNSKPALAPEAFFNGKLTAHGVLKNRSGEVTRWFSATIDASWQNGIGTLDEAFIFNDG